MKGCKLILLFGVIISIFFAIAGLALLKIPNIPSIIVFYSIVGLLFIGNLSGLIFLLIKDMRENNQIETNISYQNETNISYQDPPQGYNINLYPENKM